MDRGNETKKEVLHVSVKLSDNNRPMIGSIVFYCAECDEPVIVSADSLQQSIEQAKEGLLGVEFSCFRCSVKHLEKQVEAGADLKMIGMGDETLNGMMEAFKEQLKKGENKS